MKYDSHILNQMMEEFPDIKQDIEDIAHEREKMRLLKEKQIEMQHDDEDKLRVMSVLERILINDIE